MEQLEFDCRLESERELEENVNIALEFACKQVKEFGLENDLIERILADPDFKTSREEIEAILQPEHFTGRSAQQTEEFVNGLIKPILDANKDIMGEKAELTV